MITDEYIKKMTKAFLSETREVKLDGSRGKFQEVEGFVFFVDIKNSTEAFLLQQDRTYLKFIHTFYAGVYRIFKVYNIREDSIKFLGDGILGICIARLNKEKIKCPFFEISQKISVLINEIIANLGAQNNSIIDGVRISIVPTKPYKLYRGKTGAYGDSKIEYNGLAINKAVAMTKIKSPHDFFVSMRIFGYYYPEHIILGDSIFEHKII